jgi:hypothetical protein
MNSLANALSPIKVALEDLLLDPNNPRFSELGEGYNEVPEPRFADAKVQKNAFDKMRNAVFDVSELRDTIKTLGFLPMDRLVVRKISTVAGDKYVVIEGNRRVTALKWLMQLHEIGKETFDDDQLANLTSIECLALDETIAPAAASLILPGLRHVSGIKEWGPYQKEKAIYALRQTGMSPQEAAQSLGLSTRSANNAYRCFLALENMKNDEEFGELVEPNMYSYFEEVFKKPTVKNWLEWSDEQEAFTQNERLNEFYGWVIPPSAEDGGNHKLPQARSVRELAEIITDDNALAVLRTSDGNLSRAIARFEVDHPEDWYPKIMAAAAALKTLTPKMLREMDDITLQSLQALKGQIKQSLDDRNNLLPAQ